MKILIAAICCCFILQINGGTTYPRHTVMFGGYYGGYPWNGRNHPHGSMGFANGDTIATNSFAGEEIPEQIPEIEETTRRVVEDKPERDPKRKPQTEEDEDTDDDRDSFASNWPFGNSGRVPSYNAFFPIMFGGGGGGGSRSGQDSGYYPGSATAIANSFSTGKGGVATSHATSFGDPYMSTLFRNGFKNKKHEE